MYKIILALLLIGCQQASAQALKATVRADSNAMLIGDHLRVQLLVLAPKGVSVNIPDIQAALKSQEWELIDISEPSVQAVDGNNNQHAVGLTITAWQVGDKSIPPLTFTAQDAGQEVSAQSQAVNIRVEAPPVVDSTYVADIKTIIYAPSSWLDYWLYYLIAFLLVVLPYPLYRLYQKYKAGTLFPKAVPPTPESIALQRLAELEQSDLLNQQKWADYHGQATTILRDYLQQRFKVRAPYYTSMQTMLSIAAHPQVVAFSKDITEVLETADMVKFAKGSPLAAANTFAIQTTRKFVESVAEHLAAEAARLAAERKAKAKK